MWYTLKFEGVAKKRMEIKSAEELASITERLQPGVTIEEDAEFVPPSADEVTKLATEFMDNAILLGLDTVLFVQTDEVNHLLFAEASFDKLMLMHQVIGRRLAELGRKELMARLFDAFAPAGTMN